MRKLYTADIDKINQQMGKLGLSNRLLASFIGEKPKSRAVEVRIGALLSGKALSCELDFLRKIEKALKLPEDSIVLSKTESVDSLVKKRQRKFERDALKLELSKISIKTNESVLLSNELFVRITSFLSSL